MEKSTKTDQIQKGCFLGTPFSTLKSKNHKTVFNYLHILLKAWTCNINKQGKPFGQDCEVWIRTIFWRSTSIDPGFKMSWCLRQLFWHFFSQIRAEKDLPDFTARLLALWFSYLTSREATEARKKQPLVLSFGRSDCMARSTQLHPSKAANASSPKPEPNLSYSLYRKL